MRTARRPGVPLALAIAGLYTLLYAGVSLVKYRNHLYDEFDLAIFAQAVSGLLHGSLASSIRGLPWLGDHASLVLFAVAPLYAAFHTPISLLVLQSAALGLGAVPAFLLARARLGSETAGVLFALAWAASPALGYANLYEFHPETLSVPCLLFMLHALHEGRRGRMALWAALALLGREDVALVTGATAVYALCARRGRRVAFAATLAALSLASLALSFAVLKPLFGGAHADFALLYGQWGHSAPEVVRTALAHPLRALGAFVATPGDAVDTALKHVFWLRLLMPLAFLPLLAPGTLALAAPILGEHFLAGGHEQHAIVYHYVVLVCPLALAAAIEGARRLAAWWRAMPARGALPAAGALCATLACQLWFGPFVPAGARVDAPPERNAPDALDRAMLPWRDAAIRGVPAQGAVVASFAFLDRFAGRVELQALHHVLSGHYTISRAAYPTPTGVTALVAETDPDRALASVDLGTGQRMRDLVSANALRPVLAAGSLVLWRRDAPARAAGPPPASAPADSVELWSVRPEAEAPAARAVRYAGGFTLLGAALPHAAVRAAGLLPVRLFWRRTAPVDRVIVLAYVLLDGGGRPVAQLAQFAGTVVNPVHLWPAGALVRTTDPLVLPADVPPGDYTLTVRVAAWDGGALALVPCDAPEVTQRRMLCPLGMVRVEGATH